jgi:mRNA-degrading endonuclease RelE of RelBE toxin-antitoxin system
MNREVVWTRRALKDLDRLDSADRKRLTSAINVFAETEIGDVRRLVDVQPPRYRLRVGNFRIIFTLAHPQYRPDAMVVLRILPRDKAYR